uniref:putative immunity protein n=1 Tax=uncultured Paraglaciecola sp. TaxID=1765024 RepID=UPI00260BA147
MTAPAFTLAAIRKLNPCDIPEGLPKRGKITAAQAVEHGVGLSDLIWVASAFANSDKDIERRLRLWMADCAARVLHIYEKDYPRDGRVRNAIVVARQYSRGEVSAAAWDAARDAAWDAA